MPEPLDAASVLSPRRERTTSYPNPTMIPTLTLNLNADPGPYPKLIQAVVERSPTPTTAAVSIVAAILLEVRNGGLNAHPEP